DNKDHALAWMGGALQHLVGPGWETSEAICINDRNQIVGCATVAGGDDHGFLLDNGNLRDLGTLGGKKSIAARINACGQVSGYARTFSGDDHAFMWEVNRGMVDLNELVALPHGWVLISGLINNPGQIACDAMVSGKRRACLLNPIVKRPAPVDRKSG